MQTEIATYYKNKVYIHVSKWQNQNNTAIHTKSDDPSMCMQHKGYLCYA